MKDNAVFAREFAERFVVANIVAFGVGDGQTQDRAALQRIRESSVVCLNADVRMLADEMQITIAKQRAGQKSRFAENLKAVADA